MAGVHSIFVGVAGGAAYIFNQTISANTLDYNLRSAAVAAGWDQVTPLAATITVNGGIYVGSTSNATYAFDTGATFPAGTTLALINNGFIIGKGGNANGGTGGPALRAQQAITIINNGTVGGGGGGGGAGAQYRAQVDYPVYGGTSTAYGTGGGGGGGGGAGYNVGTGGAVQGGTGNGTGTPTDYYEAAGANGTIGAPGSGGTAGLTYVLSYDSQYYVRGGNGGNGGALGAAGSSGAGGSHGPSMYGGTALIAATAGGAAGACTNGNANITWAVTGTRLGTLG